MVAIPVTDNDPQASAIHNVSKGGTAPVLQRIIDTIFDCLVEKSPVNILVQEVGAPFICSEDVVA